MDTTPPATKTCKSCSKTFDKTSEFFYKAARNSFQSCCKPCHNAKRSTYARTLLKPKPRRVHGVQALDPVRQKVFYAMVAHGDKVKDISSAIGISIPTIYKWIRENVLKK